jgi:hypothetical protein
MNPNDFNEMLSFYKPQEQQAAGPAAVSTPAVNSTSAASVPAAPHEKGNWFTNNLSTGLSVGGGILGAVFGGGVGGIGGATGGAALGKLIENKLEGNGAGDDVAKAAVEGGVGQALGGIAGKALGKGAQILGKRAESIAAKSAAEKLAKDEIAGRANALKDINPKLQSEFKANDSLDHVKNMGFNPTDASHVEQVATSSNDVLNDMLNKALAESGPVNLGHYNDLVKAAIAQNGGTLGSFDKVALSRGRFSQANTPAAKLLAQLEQIGQGIAKDGADPNEIRTLTTKLGKMAADAKPVRSATTGAIDPEQEAVHQVIKNVRDQVKDSLYNRPEVSGVIKAQTGNLSAEDVGSQQLADHLNNVITQAGQGTKGGAQDILDEMSKNINISKLGQEMGRVRQIASSTGGQARAAGDAGLDAVEEVSPAAEVAKAVSSNGGGGVINTAIKGALHAKDNPAILNTLSRIGALGEKIAPPAGAAVAVANGQLQSSANIPGDMTMQPQTDAVASTTPGIPDGGLSRNDLLTLALYSPQAFDSLVTPSAGQQQQVVAANSAEQALSGLQGQSPDGGILSSMAGKFGLGATGAYDRKAKAAAQQIAAAMPGTDAASVEAMLTNYTAGGANIDQAIAQLMQNLHAVKQGNTNTSFQSLMNYQPGGHSVMSQVPVGA